MRKQKMIWKSLHQRLVKKKTHSNEQGGRGHGSYFGLQIFIGKFFLLA